MKLHFNTKNMCSKQRGTFFLVYKYERHVFKVNGNLLFSLFSHFSNTKNLCSKQAGDCFLVYWITFLMQKTRVQTRGKLIFSSLSCFFNTKNVWSKQAGGCFLVYSATFVIRKMGVQNKPGGEGLVFSFDSSEVTNLLIKIKSY